MIRKLGFPKSSRLLKSREFYFPEAKRLKTSHFVFVIQPEGTGRLGISISKKVLKKATDRNRVKRLLREVFRLNYDELKNINLHVIGKNSLLESMKSLDRSQVEKEFLKVLKK